MGGITGFHDLCMALVLLSLVYHRERLHSDIMDSTYDSELQAGHPLIQHCNYMQITVV